MASEVTKRVINSLKESGLKGIDFHTSAGIAVNKMFGKNIFDLYNSRNLEEEQISSTAILIFLKNLGIEKSKNEDIDLSRSKSRVEVSESY